MNKSKNPYQGTVCWVTGASGGIGAALAIALNQQGAYVVITARRTAHLEEVKAVCLYPERVVILPGDMEETEALPALARQAWHTFSHLDFVFLNAGMAVRDLFINTELALLQKVMAINFFSAAAITKTLLPLMKERGTGCFVITSSLSGKYGIPRLSAYAASKHALHGLFDSIRAENKGAGIQVTIVVPGLIKTDISLNALTGDGGAYGKMQASIANGISAKACAQQMLKAVARNKHEVVIGGPETYSVLAKRLFPDLFNYLMSNHPLQKLRRFGFFK